LIKSLLRKNGSSCTGLELQKKALTSSESTLNQPLISQASNNL